MFEKYLVIWFNKKVYIDVAPASRNVFNKR